MKTNLLRIAVAGLVFTAFCGSLTAAPGDLDTTFGGTGKVTTDFGSNDDTGLSLAVQSDGRIVVAGRFSNGSNWDFALARYMTDGSLDPTFNGTGKVTTAIGSSNEYANCVVVQSDGKIVTAGYSFNGSNNDFALVRYHSNGTLDTTFNGNGKVTTPIGSSHDDGRSVAVQSDGKIVVAGVSSSDFALVRYNANGTLDTSFNGAGKVTTPIGRGSDFGHSVAVQSDGKIVVAGFFYNGSDNDFALVRYNANGSLDTSFNGTGKVTTPIGSGNESGNSLAVQSDGKIVVAGESTNGTNADFALVRYNANGTLDTTFNGTGKVTTPIGSNLDVANSLAVQSDGKIVVAGTSIIGGTFDFALVRYNANGSLDTSFNGTGKVTTPIGSGNESGNSLAVQSDGKIVVAGQAQIGGLYDIAVVRYLGDSAIAPAITSPPQSRIVVAGQSTTFTVQVTANPAPTYQWRRFGTDIPGATGATLTLSNVQLADAGNYSVVVSNPSGIAISSPAQLSVLSNLDTVSPLLPTYSPITPEAGKDSLVFITHGRTPEPEDWDWQVAWLDELKDKIKANVASNWLVLKYEWKEESISSIFVVRGKAKKVGAHVGKTLKELGETITPNGRWEHIHFIAHSAGSALIEEASGVIDENFPATVIHTTFLDPYTGPSDNQRPLYGGHSDWSDNYFTFSPDTKDGLVGRTFGALLNSHNVEVTWLDPPTADGGGRTLVPQYCASQYSTPATLTPCSYAALSTHDWPIDFYQNTIPPIPADRPTGYGSYGFPLSKEAGGWTNGAPSLTRGNDPPVVLAAQSGVPNGSIPQTLSLQINFATTPHAVGQTGSVMFTAPGFTATSGGAQFSAGPANAASESSEEAPLGSPAWVAIPVAPPSQANLCRVANKSGILCAGKSGKFLLKMRELEWR